MGFNLVIKSGALRDIDEILGWHKKQEEGLEKEVHTAIFGALRFIEEYPEYAQEKYRGVRIKYMKRFPYGIHYTTEGTSIFVHALLHTARKPRV